MRHRHEPVPSGAPGEAITRRRFVDYLIAAPTLAAGAQLGFGALEQAAGAVIPSSPEPADLYDLTDLLTDATFRSSGNCHASNHRVPGGAGELAVAPVMAAVACAYAKATGVVPATFPINDNGPLGFVPYPTVPPLPESPTDGLANTF